MSEIVASRIASIADPGTPSDDQPAPHPRAKSEAEKLPAPSAAPLGDPEEQHALDETA